MGEKAIENRIRKLQEIEAQQKELETQQKELETQVEAIRTEIKADMEMKGLVELKTKNFIIRWKEIISKGVFINGNNRNNI